ncbi:CaiB/BaiF CoA transferase family protein [Georgenia sp. AZ-5]|uniref:CaiB/BaiF CoA transferase family protein n=1 Tax=Georgenia sp. AZ-5 TaxID=3367526 RepID=UPI0037541641
MNERLALLDGVRIVGFTQWLFGPAAAQYLGDMGAEVIKVEPPVRGSWERAWAGGNTFLNEVSACFLLTHRNVRSIALDLREPTSQDAARRLISSADIVIENYRPGVMEKFGLDYHRVREIKPDIIYASASGYGRSDGPYRRLPGQDLLIQALTGLIWAGGQDHQVPRPAGAAVVDQHAALLLAAGILGALLHRERTGKGQEVEVTMVEAALDLQLEPVVYYMNGGTVEQPATPIGSAFHQAPYGVYPTRDGYVVLSLSPITSVSAALGAPPGLAELSDRDSMMGRRDEIYRIISPLVADRERDELVAELRGHGVWCAPVLDYAEMLTDPGVQHLSPVQEVDDPRAGRVRLLRHPIRYSSGEPRIHRPPPAVGEHSREILAELGYSPEEIDDITSSSRPRPQAGPGDDAER